MSKKVLSTIAVIVFMLGFTIGVIKGYDITKTSKYIDVSGSHYVQGEVGVEVQTDE